ncbi:ECF-type sigma factor [Planctomycetaceae bacterium SH139]
MNGCWNSTKFYACCTRSSPRQAELVKLRFFAGLSLKDAAACLGISRRQGDRLWAFA